MKFDLNDDQKAIGDVIERLLTDTYDDTAALKGFESGVLDPLLWKSLMDLGLGSILLSDTNGGLGMDLLTLAVAAESLAKHAIPGPIWHNALASWLIEQAASAAQRERWCAALAGGNAIAAFALLEPGHGWLPSDWTFTGRDGADKKSCVEWGERADVYIVGLSGGRLGLIERASAELYTESIDVLDRTRPLVDLTIRQGPIEALGENALATRLIDALLVLYSADALGASARAFDIIVEYAKNRVQFGQPIGRFQAVKHQLANVCLELEPCRPLLWYAAHAWDTECADVSRAAAMLKAHVTDVAVRAARISTELHGGIGYTWEYPIHVFLKRAMASRVLLGMPAVHRERAAAMAGW